MVSNTLPPTATQTHRAAQASYSGNANGRALELTLDSIVIRTPKAKPQ